ncbi:unnamed protein product [Chrysoparadoxa australica]
MDLPGLCHGATLSMGEYGAARMKMDELFFAWLGQRETAEELHETIRALSNNEYVARTAGVPILTMLACGSNASTLSPRSISPRKSPGQLNSSPSAAPPRSPTAAKVPYNWGSTSGLHSPTTDRQRTFERYLNSEKHQRSQSRSSNISSAASEDSHVSAKQLQPDEDEVARKSMRRTDIPEFYIPGEGGRGRGKRIIGDSLENRRDQIAAMFAQHGGSLGVEDFVPVTKTLCAFPSFFNAVLFQRILNMAGHPNDVVLSEEDFCAFWAQEMEPYDTNDRFFRLVKQPEAEYIVQDDFQPFLSELLMYHPGLEFLENHPDFHVKYAATVTTRIFYTVNVSRNGRISARELRRSNLVEMFNIVDEEEDINKVSEYFSYEHFYVLFCRFYELDTDRDSFLSDEDLLKYGDHGLSRAIVKRIMDAGARLIDREEDRQAGRMSYADYIYFMLSEEDKGAEQSLRYWFDCLDISGEGRISHIEMMHFYDLQIQRMESLGHEVVPYRDMICQMWDMLKLGNKQFLELQDFLRPDVMKNAGLLFDCLFNLNKFIGFEQRDPFSERQKASDPFEKEWERFAFHDYNRLAAEDEREGTDSLEGGEMELGEDWVVTEDDDGEVPF